MNGEKSVLCGIPGYLDENGQFRHPFEDWNSLEDSEWDNEREDMTIKKTDLTFCGQPRDPDTLMFGMAMHCEPDASLDDPGIKNLLEYNYITSRHNSDWLDLRMSSEAEYVQGDVQEDEHGKQYRPIGWCVRTDKPWREESGEKFLTTTETSMALTHLWDAVGKGECSVDVYRAVLMSFWLLDEPATV